MKKLFPALCLGIVLMAGCATEVGIYAPPPPYVYYGPYYGPYWHEYYWHPEGHYYYRPGPGRRR